MSRMVYLNLKDYWAILTAYFMLMLILLGLRFSDPLSRPESNGAPLSAISAIPNALKKTPVFNAYGFGGSLIQAGVPVFIDGRADMYGDIWMHDYIAISNGDINRWNRLQRRWGFCWTMLSPQSKLSSWLDRQKSWTRIYSDTYAVIHVKNQENGNLSCRIKPA